MYCHAKHRTHNAELTVLAAAIILSLIWAPRASAILVSGPVDGSWTLDQSPIEVVADITVLDGHSLTIYAGVVVHFDGPYSFKVLGFLSANGDSVGGQYIFFTNDSLIWKGIKFDEADGRPLLNYCVINNAWVALDLINSNVTVSGCEINAHSVGINCESSNPRIRGNRITVDGGDANDPYYTAISLHSGSSPEISGNRIECRTSSYGEVFGIYARGYSNPRIYENWIMVSSSRKAHAIDGEEVSKLPIERNIIRAHGYQEMLGVYLQDATGVYIYNNDVMLDTVSCNETPVCLDIGANSQVNITNNILLGNYISYGVRVDGTALLAKPSGYNNFWLHNADTYGNCNNFGDTNLDSDPKFADGGNYQLDSSSQCIDAGYPDWRDPDGTRSDIGRWYFPHEPPVSVREQVPEELQVLSAYPNPFNSEALAVVSLIIPSSATLTVRDSDGRLVRQLFSGPLSAGVHRFPFNAGTLPSGIYLIRLDNSNGTGATARLLHLP